MAYATLQELRDYTRIPDGDTLDDDVFQVALDASAALVDHYTGRTFGVDAEPTVRYYTRSTARAVAIDEVQTTAGLVVETDDDRDGVYETDWTLDTDYRLGPVNSAARGRPWTRLEIPTWSSRAWPSSAGAVKVTAAYGYTEVPAAVKQATLQQASRLVARRESPYGVAGSPELGSEVRLLARLDPDVELLLRAFRRSWAIVVSR